MKVTHAHSRGDSRRKLLAIFFGVIALVMLGFTAPAANSAPPPPKENVCHTDGQGNWDIIKVTDKAYNAHVKHGDPSDFANCGPDPEPGEGPILY